MIFDYHIFGVFRRFNVRGTNSKVPEVFVVIWLAVFAAAFFLILQASPPAFLSQAGVHGLTATVATAFAFLASGLYVSFGNALTVGRVGQGEQERGFSRQIPFIHMLMIAAALILIAFSFDRLIS